jgi:uncharacterized protein (TIGR00645 family)
MDRSERTRHLLRRAVRFIYLLQIPLFFGLMLALVVFGATFFYSIVEAVWTLEFLNRHQAILLVLDLLDMVFIANLIVMVMVSGYNSYSSTTALTSEDPEALTPRDEFAPIKSKIAATLVIISGIHIVHEMLAEQMSNATDLLLLGGLHLVLLVTAVVLFWIAQRER